MKKGTAPQTIKAFHFPNDKIIANKYRVIGSLGAGWEGEVYKIEELDTKIVRAAKCFFPHRNRDNKVAVRYAKMLHHLSNCPIIIHYHTHEFIQFQNQTITCLISEYVDGEILSNFLKKQPGNRLGPFRALHLLHALISGIESIHHAKGYHGDLHTENIIIKRYGLGFDLKLLDMYHWSGYARRTNMEDDIIDSIKIFYEAIGGRRHYANAPKEVKAICMGLKRSLIRRKFPTAGRLREYLENINWQTPYSDFK